MLLNQNMCTVIFLLIGFPAFCQNREKDISLGVWLGPSVPTGNFAKTDNLSGKSFGFAATGENINMSIERKTTKHLWLSAMLYGQRNPLNTKALSHQFSDLGFNVGISTISGGPPSQPPPQAYFSNWNTPDKNWYLESFLLGAAEEFILESSSRFSIKIKGMIGIAHGSIPDFSGTSRTDSSEAYISKKGGSAFCISLLGCGSMNYQINQRICLALMVEYIQATLSFPHVTQTAALGESLPFTLNSGFAAYEATVHAPVKQSVNGLNINFGLTVVLGRLATK